MLTGGCLSMSLALKLQKFNRDGKWRLFNEQFTTTDALRVLDVGVTDKEFSDYMHLLGWSDIRKLLRTLTAAPQFAGI